MAVQAQYPSNAFAPDFRVRAKHSLPGTTHANALIESHVLPPGEQQRIFVNGAGISGPESELTCTASGSRKRYRDDEDVMFLPQPGHRNPHQHQNSHGRGVADTTAAAAAGGASKMPDKANPATLINPNSEQSRLQGSAGTSTSGRLPTIPPSPKTSFLISTTRASKSTPSSDSRKK